MNGQEKETAAGRRAWLRSVVGGGAATVLTGAFSSGLGAAEEQGPVVRRGRVKHSLVHWCFKPAWPKVDELCEVARRLGCRSIELIAPEHWPTLQKYGLTCAIAGSHGFRTGPNNRDEWDACRTILSERLQQCREFGVKRIITFTGMANGVSKEQGADNCVAFFQQIVGEAERHDVTLCLEMLNTRDGTHPMKGHPGYQGDDLEYCVEIVNRVGSPYLKLLFDIYHVQIMHGDVIRRLRQYKDLIAHVHTAGNPGRGELDDTQEINYPAVMQALVDIGYDGYVGQEYLPTRDPWEGLQQAVATCDV